MSTSNNSTELAIQAENVSKKFLLGLRSTTLKDRLTGFSEKNREEFWAFEDVSVDVPKGSMLGIIGRNGSGKSTFLRTLCGVYRPTTGQVQVRGRITALLELGAGFHAELTGRENIFMNGAVVGLSREYMESVMDEIVDMADIGSFIDAPIETYSSGMRARLGFAVSVQLQPEILLADEITAVGDIAFKTTGMKRMNELRERGATIVQVSHNLPMLSKNCDQVLWLHHGRVRRIGDPKEVIDEYVEHGSIDGSGRKIGAAPGAQPKPAAIAPSVSAAIPDDPRKTDFRGEWFEKLSLSSDEAEHLVAGGPCRLRLKIKPTREFDDLSVLARFYVPAGRFTGFSFNSGTLSPEALDGQIEGFLPVLGLSAGNYVLRVDLLSGEKSVAKKFVEVKIRWFPAGTEPNEPTETAWNVVPAGDLNDDGDGDDSGADESDTNDSGADKSVERAGDLNPAH